MPANRLVRIAAVSLALTLASAPVLADSGRLRVTTVNGGAAVGELVEDVPGSHLTIILRTGDVRTFAYDEIERVEPLDDVPAPASGGGGYLMGESTPASEGGYLSGEANDADAEPTEVSLGGLAPDERAALLAERERLLDERPGFGAPITFLAIGGAMTIAGGMIFLVTSFDRCYSVYADDCYGDYCYDDYSYDYSSDGSCGYWSDGQIAGATMAGLGTVGLIVGGVTMAVTASRRSGYNDQIEAIDEQLGGDVDVSVAPLVGPMNGVAVTVRF